MRRADCPGFDEYEYALKVRVVWSATVIFYSFTLGWVLLSAPNGVFLKAVLVAGWSVMLWLQLVLMRGLAYALTLPSAEPPSTRHKVTP